MSSPIQVPCPHCHAVNRLPAGRLDDGPVCGRCRQPLFTGQPVELDESAFARHLDHSGLPLVVDFWAPWCGPCRTMAPHFAQAAGLLEPAFRLAKVNTEEQGALASRYGIRSIPTLVLFEGGREIARTSGAMPAQALVEWVRAHRR